MKEIYHCNVCGLCRIGKGEDLFHCNRCNCCYQKSSMSSHVCSHQPLSELSCPLCMDTIHSSQMQSTTLPCAHVVHSPCLSTSLRRSEYRCPLCRKSMVDMQSSWNRIRQEIIAQPMPDGPVSMKCVCFDCGHKGESMFHYFGMECSACGSFNTSR
jgi:RING finger/CHY zinc finger protein 1